MSGHNLYIWGMIQCNLVEVEAMKAANQQRLSMDQSPAYDDKAFFAKSEEIANLAKAFDTTPGN